MVPPIGSWFEKPNSKVGTVTQRVQTERHQVCISEHTTKSHYRQGICEAITEIMLSFIIFC